MNIYNLGWKELEKEKSDFHNNMYGRKIWLIAKVPYVLALFSLIAYIVLTLIGSFDLEAKELVTNFILGDIICFGLGVVGSVISELFYEREFRKYMEKEKSNIPKPKPVRKPVTKKVKTK